DPGQLCQGLPGQVVLRRAQAAGREHQVGAAGGDAKGGDVLVEVVGDGGVPVDGDADLGQAQAEPLAVGVEVLAARQFAADGEDFGFHGGGPGGGRESFLVSGPDTCLTGRPSPV